jgi:hypothetical protein
MDEEPGFYDDLVVVARARIAAASKNKNAALDVVRQSAVALRGLLSHGQMPDPERCVYLEGLLNALERIEGGEDPTKAMHLRPSGRTRDEKLFGRNLAAFIDIGREFDRLSALGRTRGDRPIDEAKSTVSKRRCIPRQTIDKVWTMFGSAKGWANLRDEVR